MSQVLSVVSICITSNIIISIDIVSNHVPPQQQQQKRTFEKLFSCSQFHRLLSTKLLSIKPRLGVPILQKSE